MKQWKPKEDEEFWRVSLEENLYSRQDMAVREEPSWGFYNFYQHIGNCYRTKKEALLALKRVKKAIRG